MVYLWRLSKTLNYKCTLYRSDRGVTYKDSYLPQGGLLDRAILFALSECAFKSNAFLLHALNYQKHIVKLETLLRFFGDLNLGLTQYQMINNEAIFFEKTKIQGKILTMDFITSTTGNEGWKVMVSAGPTDFVHFTRVVKQDGIKAFSAMVFFEKAPRREMGIQLSDKRGP